MASITRHRERWRAQVFRHGTRVSQVFDTKREAQAWALKKEAELDGLAATGGRSFGALVAEYLKRVTPRKRATKWEEQALARLLTQIGPDVRLADLDASRISLWRDKRLETVSGSTVQRESNLLRNMFRVARDEWRWIDHNPFQGVKLPKHNPARTSVWPWQLIKRVLRSGREGKTGDVVRAFRVSLHTAMRLQEVLTGAYDARRRVYVLPRTKAGEVQEVPVTRRAARILPQSFTVTPNEASVLFSKLCRELLITGLTFHDARASALTWMARRMDVLTLARISRHRDLSILQRVYYRETVDQIAARLK